MKTGALWAPSLLLVKAAAVGAWITIAA